MSEAVLEGVRNRHLQREYARVVAWSEFGDGRPAPPESPWHARVPVFVTSRPGPVGAETLRVITTERPGFGASSRLPGRHVSEPADDLAAILDHLGLDAVHVLGGSGSAPHQLAFAARHPDRVRATTVLVGAAPLTDDEADQLIGVNA